MNGAAAHRDLFLCAVYKYSYLINFTLQARNENNVKQNEKASKANKSRTLLQ